VDCAGEEAFAGPRLAEDQNGGKAARRALSPKQLLDLIPDGDKRRAVTY
jgi:hypothetical protein